MTVRTKVTVEDYRKFMFQATYKRPLTIIMMVIGILGITNLMFNFQTLLENGATSLTFGIVFIVYLFILPFIIYWQANKSYETNQRLHETITYEFNLETWKVTGESFNSEMTWVKTFKVKETKDWFLIYNTKLSANILPKKYFEAGQQTEFKHLLQQISGLKIELMKNA